MLAVAAAIATALAASSAAASAPTTERASYNALEKGLLTEINTFRRSHGLTPLRFSVQLTAAADQHSNEMARVGYFAHESADGSGFDKRITRFYSTSRYHRWSIGENLVWESPELSAGDALQMWLNSPPHRANLLNASWRQIGISAVHAAAAPGTYGGRPATIVTADFGFRS
jgi:uncharacterized protein YkwD